MAKAKKGKSKNIVAVIILLAVASLALLGILIKSRRELLPSPRPHSSSPQSQLPTAGGKLADLEVAKSAFQVFPGDLTDSAKAALAGWNVSTSKNKDGSTTVTLATQDGSKKSSYKLGPGQTLYFIESSTGDDNENTNTDINLRDDYGIVVNADGIIQ